ncbi:CidA/LrgA family protein [Alphaproteobacteria bacterium]|nr:CidA/LrgA family protein [Alphaproteobacteria bacterium]
MLNSIFIILLFQLMGEFIQKFFEFSIPGPVIGLIFLLSVLLIIKKINKKHEAFDTNLVISAENLLSYLPLLFIPVGVGVVMHLSLLEENLVSVLLVIVFGTLLTLALTGYVMEKLLKDNNLND